MQKGVLTVTTKLKRYKYLMNIMNVFVFPIRFPLFLIYYTFEKVSEFFEWLVTKFDYRLLDIRDYIIHRFNWNEIAKEQRKKNPNKFI
jgi:hypothetical protein